MNLWRRIGFWFLVGIHTFRTKMANGHNPWGWSQQQVLDAVESGAMAAKELEALREKYVALQSKNMELQKKIGIIEDQKRRIGYQASKITELTLLCEQQVNTPEEIRAFQAQLSSWFKTYDGSTTAWADFEEEVKANPAEMWKKFMAHLKKVQPLDKEGKLEHMNLIGSAASYKQQFITANK